MRTGSASSSRPCSTSWPPGTPRRIISTGGDLPARKANRKLLKRSATSSGCRRRSTPSSSGPPATATEPLLDTEHPRDRVLALLAEREPFYRETADLAVETAGLDAEELALRHPRSARYHFTGGSLIPAVAQAPTSTGKWSDGIFASKPGGSPSPAEAAGPCAAGPPGFGTR